MANTKRFQVKHGLRTKDIEFTDNSGASNEIIASFIDATDTLSFSGNSGQLFAITDSITGSIFTVNDISGMPSIEVKDTGDIILAETAGNVGIGTNNPATALDVVGTSAEVISVNSTADGSQINFSSATNLTDWIIGVANDATDDFIIYQSAAGAGDLRLYTDGKLRQEINANGDISFYDSAGALNRLFWDASAESLGIGTTSPANDAKIHSVGSIISTDNTLGSYNFDNAGFDFVSATKVARFFATSTDTTGGIMTFVTGQNGSYDERMRITSAGKILVPGTSELTTSTSIEPTFQIIGQDAATSAMYITRDENSVSPAAIYGYKSRNSGAIVLDNDELFALNVEGSDGANPIKAGTIKFEVDGTPATNNIPTAIVFERSNGTAGLTESMRITSAGNVGIGTLANVDEILHVEKTSGTTLVKTEVASNSIVGFEIAKTNATTQSWRIVDGQTVNGVLEFHDLTNNATRMAIDGTGDVGIGTPTPAVLLHTLRTSTTAYNAASTTNDTTALFQNQGAAGHSTIQLQSTSSGTANTGQATISAFNKAASSKDTILSFGVRRESDDAVYEAMRIDGETGNVGIGTPTPSAALSIFRETNTTGTTLGTTLLNLTNDVGADLNQQKTFVDFIFLDDNGNEYPQVRIGAEVGPNANAGGNELEGEGAFVVYTNNATGSGPAPTGLTEKMRVDYQGNVGIGENNPTQKFQISADSGAARMSLQRSNTNTTGGVGSIQWNALDGHAVAGIIAYGDGDDEGAHLTFNTTSAASDSDVYVSTTEAMRITSDGNVGIGTISPTNKFEVAGTQGQLFSVADSFTGTIFTVNDGSGVPSVEVMDTGDIYLAEFGGNVGIGTSSPARPLEISFASETFGLRLTRNDAVGNSLLEFANTSGVQNYIGHDAGLNAFVINNDGANKVVVTDSGNVGIGTNTPTYLFTVDDLGAADGTQNEIARFSNTTAGATSNYIYIGASSGPDWKIGKNVPGTSARSNFDIADNADAVRLTIQSSGEVISPAAGLYGNMGTAWHTGNAMRGGNFSADIANDTTVLKLFPASINDESSNARAVGDYSAGIGFMHLDPDNSTWGGTYFGAHAWIGLKVSSTTGQELSDLVFATNGSTTNGSYPTQAAKLSGAGVLTLDKANTYALHIISSGSTGNTQGSIVLQSSTVDSPESRGQGVYMFNEGTDRTWYMGTQYNSAGSFHISTLAGTALDESTAANTNYALRIDSNKSAAFASSLTVGGDITISETTPQLNINDTNATNATDQLGYISFQRIGVESAWIGYGSVSSPEFVIRNTEGSLVIRNSNGEVELRSPDNNNTISMIMDNTDTLSFEGDAGQLFSLSDSFTGTIFSVNDGSGIPSIEVIDTGDVYIAEFGGSVGVGNSAPAYKLDVTGDIRATGDVLSTSDERLKDDIQPIENALDKVTAMNGVSFKYKGTDKASVGLIAQNVEQVVPEVVQEDNAGYKAVSYGNLVGVLIEAIKEQQSTINSLVSRIEKLEKGE